MNLDMSKWKPFTVDDLFYIYNGSGITKEEMDVYGHTTEQMHQEAAERFQASISERLSSQSF